MNGEKQNGQDNFPLDHFRPFDKLTFPVFECPLKYIIQNLKLFWYLFIYSFEGSNSISGHIALMEQDLNCTVIHVDI
jgi:hypothetical protein